MKKMDFYVDYSNRHTPLEEAEYMDWFEHAYLVGNEIHPMEERAFLLRFPIEKDDLTETKAIAVKIRSKDETDFQRGVVRVAQGGMQTTGIKERLLYGKNDYLFFPNDQSSDDAISSIFDIELLKVPSPTGHGMRVIATVPVAKEYSGAIFDIRVPSRFLQWADQKMLWNEVMTRQDGMVVQRQFFLMDVNDNPWCAFNPMLFYRPFTLPQIRYNFFTPVGQKAVVSDFNSYFSSAILLALLRHETVPYMDSEAVNVHHALIGLLHQADMGWEKYAVQLREGVLPSIRVVQQAMNTAILYLTTQNMTYSVQSSLNHFLSVKKALFRIDNGRNILYDFIDLIHRNPIGEINQNKIMETNFPFLEPEPRLLQTVEMLLVCETMHPEWRMIASTAWNVTVDTTYCQNLFLFLLIRVNFNIHWNTNMNDDKRIIRDAWKQEAVRKPFIEAILQRMKNLESCYRDALFQMTKMLKRFGMEGKTVEEITELTNTRKILRDAFFNIERLLQQQDELRLYALKVEQMVSYSYDNFHWSLLNDNQELKNKMFNAALPQTTTSPFVSTYKQNISPPLLKSQYTTTDLLPAELTAIHDFHFTPEKIKFLLNKP